MPVEEVCVVAAFSDAEGPFGLVRASRRSRQLRCVLKPVPAEGCPPAPVAGRALARIPRLSLAPRVAFSPTDSLRHPVVISFIERGEEARDQHRTGCGDAHQWRHEPAFPNQLTVRQPQQAGSDKNGNEWQQEPSDATNQVVRLGHPPVDVVEGRGHAVSRKISDMPEGVVHCDLHRNRRPCLLRRGVESF